MSHVKTGYMTFIFCYFKNLDLILLHLGRPMSPHLSIYAWSIPMTMSAFNRIFAFGLTFAFLAIPVIDLWQGDFVNTVTETR